jgi:RHS repeat-associated protein
VGGIHYEKEIHESSSTLKFMQTTEGRFNFDLNRFEYDLKDHLGNVRVSIADESVTPATREEYFYDLEQGDVFPYSSGGTYTTTTSLSGVRSVVLQSYGDTDRIIDAHVNAGDIVTFRVYGYSLYASGEISLYLKNESVYHLSATGGEVIASQGIPIAGGVWKKFELVDVEIPYSGSLDFRIKNNSSHAEVYFDDIHIEVYTPSSGEYSVIQRDDYYPFGGTFNSYTGGDVNLYKYNGKEEQEETGWYDYGARMYDPWLGRFFTQDRFASKYYDLSPYQYTANNPINFIDINGDSIWVANGDERFLYTAGAEYKGDNKFIGKAVGDLNKIAGTKKGAKRIGDLVGSESNYNIMEAKELGGTNGSRYEGNPDGGGDLYYYQGGGSLDGVGFYDSEFVVGHELQHAWDHDQGKSSYFSDIIAKDRNGQPIKMSERNAVEFENYLRASAGETRMRTLYSGERILNNTNPNHYLNKADPLRKNEGLLVPNFYRSPATDATYVAPNIKVFRVNTQTGRFVNPNE